MRTTVSYFQKQKDSGVPISMLTAYDATAAQLVEAGGVRTILVGDSLGMVIQGHDNTVPVTLDNIIYHTQLVVRGTQKAFIVSDMPFMSYNISPQQALKNAARCLQLGGSQSVKVEGGERMADTIHTISSNGIPVLAHIGLTPQSVYSLGGWKVQGKTEDGARQLIADAKAVQAAGAYAVVLELVPTPLAELISQTLTIPTIGIGAGAGCDGQVQVFHDILGLIPDFSPKHAKQFATLGKSAIDAVAQYRSEVEARTFPTEANAPSLQDDVLESVYSVIQKEQNA